MLIVVEGIDGSGKSTLISNLAHELEETTNPLRIIRKGPIARHPMEEYEYDLKNYAPGFGVDVLCDRWHTGELIYGPLYRGVSQVTPAMKLHIDLVLQRLGALKVFMNTPLAEVQRRLSIRGEEFLKPQHQQLVWDAYQEQCGALDGWVHVAPRTASRAIDFANILELAGKAEKAVESLDDFATYIGPPDPKLLILGDKRGPQRQGRPHYQWAFVPYRDTSGHFLFTALSAVDLHSFGVANACEENISELWEKLGKPRVIAMGVQAMDQVQRHFKEVELAGFTYHPQYVRRFMQTKMSVLDYGLEFRSMLDG